jgi:uncharacterized membrane protein YhaH (DUF805 family)
MHWFIDPIKNHYADFNGRVGRQEFWMFVLFSFLIQIALDIVGLDMVSVLVSLALLVPSLALGARRLHDTGRSGWWQLIGLIPIIGWIIIIVWFATKTENENNMYGSLAVQKTGPETEVAPVVGATAVSSDPVVTEVTPSEPTPEKES